MSAMSVTTGNVIRIDCELRVKGGEIIESSSKTGPVEYRHGSGQLPVGLEAKLEGMTVGEEKNGVLSAAEAFGTEEAQPKMTLSRSQFPPDISVEPGARFTAKSPQGTPLTLEVLSMEADAAVARVVHPLAGKEVEFSVKILSIRPPPPPVPNALESNDLELVEENDG
jgi:FKBP-type peptidyl-prolyl cis-trans isomerase SlyD